MKLTKTTLKMELLEAPARVSSTASADWTTKAILLSVLHTFPQSVLRPLPFLTSFCFNAEDAQESVDLGPNLSLLGHDGPN